MSGALEMDLLVAAFVLGALVTAATAGTRSSAERLVEAAGSPPDRGSWRATVPLRAVAARWPWALGTLSAALGTWIGVRLIGPLGVLLGVAGVAVPFVVRRRRARRDREALEAQLGDVASTVALAVRSGLSIPQSLAFAAEEAEPPIRSHLERVLDEQRVGTPLEGAVASFADALGSDEARLFVLILLTHARTGGNVAGALEEVAATIRHRTEARRELRALSAQGRVSGAILGALPIAFFLVLAATSRRDLGPVYRSAAGVAMVLAGLALEGVAYLWIRRLLRIET